MKKLLIKKSRFCVVLGVILFLYAECFAEQCTPAVKKAMGHYGLTEQAIEKICANADQIHTARPEITVEKIESDIAGRIVGTWIFQPKEWREIEILASKYSENKARITIDLDTIRNKGGELKLIYQWVEGKWKLVRIINESFQ